MGYGMWRKFWPADKAVDGSIDTNMDNYHCSWVQNYGPLSHSWKVDLRDFYDVETMLLYSTNSECIKYENTENTNTVENKTVIRLFNIPCSAELIFI